MVNCLTFLISAALFFPSCDKPIQTMLLYWGMFTIGFSIGAIFAFITFAPKKPEEEYQADWQSEQLLDANSPGTP
ncbi:MAG: hypothetical protein AAB840_01540 [Patescibacteria group bacterium]